MSIFKKIALLWKSRKTVKEILEQKENIEEAVDKHTWKSTEFLGTVLCAAGAVLAQVAGVIPEPFGTAIASSVAVLYQLGRGWVKHDDSLGGVKPAVGTTEFWVGLCAAVSAALSGWAGVCGPETSAVLVALSAAGHEVSRTLAKSGKQPPELEAEPKA